MKTIIAGSRDITSYSEVEKACFDAPWKITEVISGGARGVDSLGERYAKEHAIPLVIFPADWDNQGNVAGIIRNNRMAKYAEALIAIWDGKSKGTENMISEAGKVGLKIHIRKL